MQNYYCILNSIPSVYNNNFTRVDPEEEIDDLLLLKETE